MCSCVICLCSCFHRRFAVSPSRLPLPPPLSLQDEVLQPHKKMLMKVAAFVRDDALARGATAFELSTPFDEVALLVENLPYIIQNLGLEDLAVVDTANAEAMGKLDDKRGQDALKAVPGQPELSVVTPATDAEGVVLATALTELMPVALVAESAAGGGGESKGESKGETEDVEGSAITDANRPYVVYADDGCIGKPAAGLLDGLDYFHQADKAAVVGNGKPTVVFFWAKFAKGDFATVNVFSYIARQHPDVQVVGISCDPHKADAEKYLTKVGVFQKELGTSGLTPEADCALAYDPERAVKERFLEATAPSSTTVGVGHSYLIDGAGTIVWRERYTRGFSPMGQMLEQVERLVAGKALVANGLKAVEADDGAEEEEEVSNNTEKIKIPGEEDY